MRKGKALLVLSLGMMLCLAGCGSSSSRESAKYSSTKGVVSDNAGVSTDSYSNETLGMNNYETEDAMDYEYEEAAPEAAEETSSTKSTDASGMEEKTNKLDKEKLVYRCNISLETKEFDNTVAAFQKLVDKYEGFIENENTSLKSSGVYYENGYGDTGLGTYTATIRVPSSKYKEFINETGEIATLRNKSQNVTNLSQEYSDLSIELEVLEAQKDNYVEMLKEAKKLEDMDNVLLISDKITSVSTQINQIKTRMNSIDNDVAYSYLDINIREVKEIVEYTEDDFATRFKKEVKQGWYNFGYAAQNFIIWFVASLPGLLIFFGIVALIIFIIKKIIKKSRKKRAERLAQMPNGIYINGYPAAPNAPVAPVAQNPQANAAIKNNQNPQPNAAAKNNQNPQANVAAKNAPANVSDAKNAPANTTADNNPQPNAADKNDKNGKNDQKRK